MKNKSKLQSRFLPEFHFSRTNVVLFALGTMVLVVGFWLMTMGPWDSTLSLTVSPLVLLLAYLVIFPISIFYNKKESSQDKSGDID
ncbi:hypothetical protein ACFLQV_03270 [Calditrichota bacterium]